MHKKEIIVLLIIIVLSLLSIFFINQSKSLDGEKTVTITVDNKIFKEIPLAPETNEEFRIVSENGYNIIKISNLQVDVIEADCPDQLCVETKSAQKKGDMIVCLPNKIIVEIN